MKIVKLLKGLKPFYMAFAFLVLGAVVLKMVFRIDGVTGDIAIAWWTGILFGCLWGYPLH